jgi:hypothetical protein
MSTVSEALARFEDEHEYARQILMPEEDRLYLGEVKDVRPVLAASAVSALPSYREGLPRAVLEACPWRYRWSPPTFPAGARQ